MFIRQIQLHESETQVRILDHLNKVKTIEETNGRNMFDLRQLLNMQQRMSNKYLSLKFIYLFWFFFK